MAHEEYEIQRDVVSLCRLLGIFVYSVPNEATGGRTVQRVERFKASGLYPGMSDLVFVDDDGRSRFVEVKTAQGRLSEKQKEFKKHCETMHWPYHVVRSVEEATKLLVTWYPSKFNARIWNPLKQKGDLH